MAEGQGALGPLGGIGYGIAQGLSSLAEWGGQFADPDFGLMTGGQDVGGGTTTSRGAMVSRGGYWVPAGRPTSVTLPPMSLASMFPKFPGFSEAIRKDIGEFRPEMWEPTAIPKPQRTREQMTTQQVGLLPPAHKLDLSPAQKTLFERHGVTGEAIPATRQMIEILQGGGRGQATMGGPVKRGATGTATDPFQALLERLGVRLGTTPEWGFGELIRNYR